MHTYVQRAALAITTIWASIPSSLFAAPVIPPGAPAPRQQLLFEWRGRVDKEIRVEMRGSRASVDLVGNKETDYGRVRTSSRLANIDQNIRVEVLDGRGRVDVVQQPSARNGYTAIVRVRDPQSGQDNYRIRAYALTSNDRYDNRGRRGDDRNDRDTRDSRDDRNDNGWEWGRARGIPGNPR